MKTKIATLFFLFLLSAAAGKLLYFAKDGFSLRRTLPLSLESTENWGEEIDQILEQSFSYLGRGRQCFAFASADNRYVLKLPRTDIYTLPFWVRALPLSSYRDHLLKDQAQRQEFLLNSFTISATELQAQTGVIATHLGKSSSQGKKLTLIDRSGCKYELPLHKTAFVLQHKHPLLMQAFLAARQKKDQNEQEKILEALLSVIQERAQRGILNRDRSFLRNYGYDGEKAYQIDIGSFFNKKDMPDLLAAEKSLRDSIQPVQEWLAENAPEILPFLNKRLEEISQQNHLTLN